MILWVKVCLSVWAMCYWSLLETVRQSSANEGRRLVSLWGSGRGVPEYPVLLYVR